MYKVVINGKPISKSNFKVVNKQGKVFMPSSGKDAKYKEYEEEIIRVCRGLYKDEVIDEQSILVLKLYFGDKRIRDVHNYPKSICDGLEKSGLVLNDTLLKPVIIEEFYDKENPRAEIYIYKVSEYDFSYKLKPLKDKSYAIMTQVDGNPISKSNFKLAKENGTSWMPKQGKYAKYSNYENEVAWACRCAHRGAPIDEPMILILNLYFKDKRKRDIHNYPKSICDGIEKGGIITNDSLFKKIILQEYIDTKNPRVEIGIFPMSNFDIRYDIKEKENA